MSKAGDPFDKVRTGAAYSRPRLRSDVEVTEQPAKSTRPSGKTYRISDPESGKSLDIGQAEHDLVQRADGRTSLRALHAGQTALTPEQVLTFFRQLNVRGLLARPDKTDPQAMSPTLGSGHGPRAGAFLERRRRAATERMPTRDRAEPKAASTTPKRAVERDLLSGKATRLDIASKPAEAQKDAGKKADTRAETQKPEAEAARVRDEDRAKRAEPKATPKAVATTRPPAKSASVASLAEKRATEPARPKRDNDKAGSEDGSRSARAAPTADPRKPETVARDTETDAAPEAKPAARREKAPSPSLRQKARDDATARKATARKTAAEADAPPTGDATAHPVAQEPTLNAFDIVTANLTAAPPKHDDDDFGDFLDLDDDGFGAFGGGGRRGGGAGGQGERLRALLAARKDGGGGMAGGMGGGLGGGGMGAGLAGAMGGGRGGGMGGGGMRMGAAPPPGDQEDGPARMPLFNPSGLLKLLYIAGFPLKYFIWAIVPLTLVAGMICFQNWAALAGDLIGTLSQVSRIWLVVIAAGTVNLVSRLAQGVAIVAHGGRVRQLGLKAMFGVLPRFYIDLTGIRALDRQGQLWSYGAPLLARLGVFGVGTFFWAVSRETGTNFADISLIAANMGIIMFVLSAFPLFPAEGQRWVGVYINEPQLVPRTLLVLQHTFLGSPLPAQLAGMSTAPYLWFGLAVLIASAAGLLTLAGYTLLALERDLGGTGVIIFIALVGAFLFWLIGLKTMIGRRFRALQGTGGAAIPTMAGTAEVQAHPLEQVTEPAGGAVASGAAKVVWALIVTGLIAVAFLPYNYEAGGPVEILPAARAQAVARTEGEVIEMFVSEGSLVSRGDVLARLSNWEQVNARNLTRSQLRAAEAALAQLEAGAKTEEIDVARTRLESAEAALRFSELELERSRELVARGTISAVELEKAESNYDANLSQVATARANLALVESSATEEELDIARANVERMTLELEYREAEIERTRIEAPMDGRVVTSDLGLRLGSFLQVGETLMEIERTDQVSAAISVPEADINLTEPGRIVRMKVRGYPGETIEGRVSNIAPAAEDTGFGRTVRVEATFENPDDFLRSGTTGYAKIEAQEMPVWQAYLRSIRRFFQIEFWSWIP